MFLNWLKKIWSLLAVVFGAMLIMGPLAKPLSAVLGGVFAQPALVIDNLAAICLVLLACDFILDSRQRWGVFPTLDLDTAIDNAINGEVDRDASGISGKEIRRPNPIASAIVVLAAVALLITILFLAVPGAHAANLDASRPYLPVLSQTLDSTWPAAPMRYIPAGQVEQESGWKKTATLKTSRELGRGLVQMTIAYDSAGRERFNIYRDAVRYRALSGWDWRRDPYNVRHQLTFLALQDLSLIHI
jgi:hypothetical protein